ncbi:(2Fe-2S)-binding protein [Corticibacter populi]|uniref:(2Fe-2S)-binding protein n=1 Tax=Corticibacter populi TaxID=1550736 RepID=A0A3M6R0A2_9BURK|nr:(2Fe-2S)-binding protein [Corticibacter populi]RMX08684.1 (2Fe-2S)-binding protein [Corticibacter populi]RZS36026.1 carbon-monoxide dehydrogenase small subunit [Corticibacter populi]
MNTHEPAALCVLTTDGIETNALTEAAEMVLRMQLNGQAVSVRCRPDTRLLTLLREYWHLVGAKPGCEVGRCGACMVWFNGAPANACLLMAYQLQGQSVRTIESLREDPASAPVKDALDACGGVQCGYCTAGMVVHLTWLHQQSPRPSFADAEAMMCGNLCRCTGYGGIRRAMRELFEDNRSATGATARTS